MIVKNARRTRNFAQISNEALNNPALQMEDLAVLCYLVSKPRDWSVNVKQLSGRFNCGEGRIRSALKRLCEQGYAEYRRLKTGHTEWSVSDEPGKESHIAKSHMWKSHTRESHTWESGTYKNTDVLKIQKDITNTETPGCAFDSFWKLYPRKQSREAAEKAWNRLKPEERQAAMEGVKAHSDHWKASDRPTRYIPHGATWRNGKRWLDELDPSEIKTAADRIPKALIPLVKWARDKGLPEARAGESTEAWRARLIAMGAS